MMEMRRKKRRSAAVVICLVVAAATLRPVSAETLDFAPYEWTEEFAGERLDLSGYRLVFADEFDRPSVSGSRGAGPWFAPARDDFGLATFDEPGGPRGTYTISDGTLKIRATKTADGRWHSGHIQSVDRRGKGFAQRYGYFEARMKFPNVPGAWTAFWLKSQAEHWDMAMIRTEIDIVEWYGGDPTGHHRSVHLRPARSAEFRTPDRLTKHWWLSNFSRHEGLAEEWHTYGALITPELVIVYLDREEVGRFPTLEEFKTPLYLLVSLTLHEADVDRAVSPFEMEVDYVRTYAPSRIAAAGER